MPTRVCVTFFPPIAIATPNSRCVMHLLIYLYPSSPHLFLMLFFISMINFPSIMIYIIPIYRQEWGHNADLRVALASAEQQLLQTEYEDYAMSQTSSIACLRSVTLIVRKQI